MSTEIYANDLAFKRFERHSLSLAVDKRFAKPEPASFPAILKASLFIEMTSSRWLTLALMLAGTQHPLSAVLPDGSYRMATPESLMADLPKYLNLYTSEVERLDHLARRIEAHLQAVQFNVSQTQFIECLLPRCGFGCRFNLAIGCFVQGMSFSNR